MSRAQQSDVSEQTELQGRQAEPQLQNSPHQQQIYQTQHQEPLQSYAYPIVQPQQVPNYVQANSPYILGNQMAAPFGSIPFSSFGLKTSASASPIIPASQQQQRKMGPTNSQTYRQSSQQVSQSENMEPNFASASPYVKGPSHLRSTTPFSLPPNPNMARHISGEAPPNDSIETPNVPSNIGEGSIPSAPYPIAAYPGSLLASPYVPYFTAHADNPVKVDEKRSNRNGELDAVGERWKQQPISLSLSSYCIRKIRSDRAISRLHELVGMINLSEGKLSDLSYWKEQVNYMFTPYGNIRYTKKCGNDFRYFEISVPMMPMMWVALGSLEVQRVELITPQLRAQVLSNGTILFHSPSLRFCYHYPDGSYITHHAQMKGSFDSALKIQWLDVCVYRSVPGMEWNSLEKVLSGRNTGYKIFEKFNKPDEIQNEKKNPVSDVESGDTERPPALEAMKELRSHITVFKNISQFAAQEGIMRVFQVCDVMSALTDLFLYQKRTAIVSPLEALNSYVKAKKGVGTSSSIPDVTTGTPTVPQEAASRNNKNIVIKKETTHINNASTACSPRELGGDKSNIQDKGGAMKRKRTGKTSGRSTRDSSTSTPSFENVERNGIPGTKKIRF